MGVSFLRLSLLDLVVSQLLGTAQGGGALISSPAPRKPQIPVSVDFGSRTLLNIAHECNTLT